MRGFTDSTRRVRLIIYDWVTVNARRIDEKLLCEEPFILIVLKILLRSA